MNENIDKKPKFLPPFRKFCMTVGELPSSYTETMSYYETLVWLCNYLGKTVIPAIDNNAEALKEVQDLFIELQDYVNHYFDNLDVQTEINNKLDDMAESGQLAEIISIYLNSQAVLGFDTVADMVASEILTDGSICKTLGNLSYDDGKGHYYKVRELESGEVIDGDNIIALDVSDTLIAAKTTTKKKMVVIGDSFSTNTRSGTPLWYTYISAWHDLDVYVNAGDGMGYSTGNNTFLQQLQTAYANLDPKDVKEIYIVGGINDVRNLSITSNDFSNDVVTTLDYATTYFPNSMIYVVGILPFQFYNFGSGNACLTQYDRAYIFQSFLSYRTLNYSNVIFRNGEYLGLIIPGYFGNTNPSNQRHPTALGEKVIANFIENGEKNYGYRDGETATYIKDTPLTCTNGTVAINRVDDNGLGIVISNYDSTSELKISMSGLGYMNTYIMITDEVGNTSALYTSIIDGNLHLPANSGLEDGTLYATIPWRLV